MPLPSASTFATRAVLCLGIGCSVALTAHAAGATQAPAPLDAQDQAFVAKASTNSTLQITMAQVVLGETAANQSASEQARDLARRIVTGHKALIAKFTDFAASKKADDQHAAPVHGMSDNKARLQQLHGKALDKAFAGMLVKADQQIIPAYEHAAKSSHAPALRKIASEALPMLREQLKAASALDRP